MKYVKNESRYALAYTYMAGAKEIKVEFSRLQHYRDTGNIATSGITVLTDDVYDALKENKAFTRALKEGILVETKAPAEDLAKDELAALKAENESLQKKLDKDSSAKALKQVEAEKEKLEKECADMKAKLEALTKAKDTDEDKKPVTDSEGF